MAMKSKYNL
jgi:hypothetical protein